MSTPDYVLWLVIQINGALLYFWYVSVPLAVTFAASVVWLARHRPVTVGAHVGLCFFFLFPFTLLLVGAIFKADPEIGDGNKVAAWVVPGLLFVALLAHGTAIVKAPGQRVAATGIAVFGLWLSLCVAFLAAMSVTGDWL